MTPPTAQTILAVDLTPGWRLAFAVDALLSVAAAALWMLDGKGFVRSTFGVADPDAVHVKLALKGGIPLLIVGVFTLGVLRRPRVARGVFAWLQCCLAGMDVLLLALGAAMLEAAGPGEPTTAAAAQIGVAAARIGLRLSYWRWGP